MQITPAFVRVFTPRRLMCVAAILAMVCGFAPIVQAQNGVNPLNLFKNYFVTGDYVVGGVGLRGQGVGGFATGTISIPDGIQFTATGVPSSSVPPGAEIVAAFLYWETIEASKTSFAGQNGFFDGYAISGKVLGNANAPDTWSRGGCSGSAKAPKTLRTYRADVRPYLPLDAAGKVQGNGHFQVKLADSGSNGARPPLTLGATLVIIYRVLSPVIPLNSIILYDGSFAPTNDAQVTSQTLDGFYQAASQGPVAKITQIVGNGHPKKMETVNLNGFRLPSLYGALPPFPGIYNRSWDNPTWVANNYGAVVNSNDSSATSTVVPADRDGDSDDDDPSKGCVAWGATVFSTTVQDTDHDGLLDAWETNQGYTDVNTGDWVALPGANPAVPDIFAQVDYLNALNHDTNPVSGHSHLPLQAALDAVGLSYKNHGINLHFDIGPNVFAGDAYVVPYPLPVGAGATPPPAGTGGHGILESSVVCTDPPGPLCEFKDQPAISWKTGFENLKSQNFWPGRKDSYRYILFGHSLGMPTSTWSATGEVVPNTLNGTLVSIVVTGTTATVTIQNPAGDPIPSTATRVTVVGALNQFALNGTYLPTSVTAISTTTTTFTIMTTGVAPGTYNFLNEPQLAVAIGGPNSTSGFSDYGGADTLITLGLWPNFDPAGCQHDPSQSLSGGQVYCADQVGTFGVQTGTLFHEMGHPLTLTHGGTYYPTGTVGPHGEQINGPQIGAPTYGENCKSNFLSAMNYLFQIFGFPDGGPIDYSGQTLADLSESSLSETNGLGSDLYSPHAAAAHQTRWYATPDAADQAIETKFGHHFASAHCDGSPKLPGEQMVKIDNSATPTPNIDWNHSGSIDPGSVGPQDINFNGVVPDPTFKGFNDWVNLNLAQIGARRNVAGFSGGVTGADIFGGGADIFGGGADIFGGGADIFGGGADIFGGGADIFGGGAGFEIDFTIASTTVDPPGGLQCTNCNPTIGTTTETAALSIPLSWNPPGFGVIQQYTVLRAEGSFPTLKDVANNINKFTQQAVINSVGGTPAATSFVDSNTELNPNNVVNGKTYTYFISDTNSANVSSGPSTPLVVTVAVPPSNLIATVSNTHEGESIGVYLSWYKTTPSLTSQFNVMRATGNCPSPSACTFNSVGTPYSTTFNDKNIPGSGTYTYYITEAFTPGGVQTGPSNLVVIYVNCNADHDGDNDCGVPDLLLSVLAPPAILLRESPAKGSILADDSIRRSLGLEDLLP